MAGDSLDLMRTLRASRFQFLAYGRSMIGRTTKL